MKSQNKIVLSGLAIGFIAFSLAGMVAAALLVGLGSLAEEQSRGISEAWFWLGAFPVLGGATAALVALVGWTMAVRRLAASPVKRRQDNLVIGATLGLIVALICAFASGPLVIVFSDAVPSWWLFWVGIAGAQIGAGAASGYLAGWVRRVAQPEMTLAGAADSPAAFPWLRLAGLVGAAVIGAPLIASTCTALYYVIYQGDLFLNAVFLGLPCAFVSFAILSVAALWFGLRRQN